MDDIARVTEAVAALPYVDAERLGAMGWSWGGYAMMWLEGPSARLKAPASVLGGLDLRATYPATEGVWFPARDPAAPPWEAPGPHRRPAPPRPVTSPPTPRR